MNKKLVRILCLVLCAVMVCGLLPAVAFAAEAEETGVQVSSITSNYGDYYFTTFEDLKQLAAGTYSQEDWVYAVYDSNEPLVISENLTMPENLHLQAYYAEVIVPAGVTLELSGYSYIDKLTVKGTVINNTYLGIDTALNVTGSVVNYGEINIRSNATLTGQNKISNQGGLLSYGVNAENYAQLKEALRTAAENSNNHYYITFGETETVDIHISGNLEIPENASVSGFENVTLTVDQGGTLTLYGDILLHGTKLVVNGTLNNLGYLQLGWICYGEDDYHYGTLAMGSNGVYMGDGTFFIAYGDQENYADQISGLNMALFTVETWEYGWELIPNTTDSPFVDIVPGAYYYDAVLWANEEEITQGYGNTYTFCPDQECTRAQIVTFLWRAAGKPAPDSSVNPFKDVPNNTWYTQAVLWAVEEGITAGYGSEDVFNPNGVCSRAEVATFLHRYYNEPAPASTANPFKDVKKGTFYYNAVLWAVENGITTGYGSADIFNPNGDCTRGQIVTFLYRALA
ncbi:MAG: S-layer homology domain-containing protein [Oscillospiraceae bacterium]|nr:S-layer homology domain-containing protein [Oscillospiraceae bacterium]